MRVDQLIDIPKAEFKKRQLDQVAKDFEKILVSQLLKSMRKTIPDWKNTYFGSSYAQNSFRDMLDNEISTQMGESGILGVSEFIKRRYTKDIPNTNLINQSYLPSEKLGRFSLKG